MRTTLSKYPKLKEGLLSLAAGLVVGASSASLSSRASDACIERTDTIGNTIVHQTRVARTEGCTIEVRSKESAEWSHRFAPEGKRLARYNGLDSKGLIEIQKADGQIIKIEPARTEIL